MGEYTLPSENVPLKPRKKMSFFAKFFIGLLIFILVLPFVLVGLVYALFYDPAHKDIKTRDNYGVEQIFNEVLSNSLDYTKSDHKIRVRLTEDHFNQLLSDAIKGLASSNGIVRNLYLEISETQYNFVMEINTYEFFKTRVILNTELSITDGDDGNICFKIKNIRLGRIDGMQKPLQWLLGVLPIGDIQSALSGSGLDIKIDISTLSMNLALSSIYDKIGEAFGSSDSSYTKMFMEMIKNTEFHTFLPNNDHAFELQINLDKMVTTKEVIGIDDYVVPSGYFDSYMNDIPSYTAELLNQGLINEDDATVVSQYRIGGLNGLTEEEKTKVQPYIDAGVISEPADPYPYHIPDEEQLSNIAKAQIESQLLPIPQNPIVVTINTNQIDRMFSASKNLGSLMAFKRDRSEDSSVKDFKISYIWLSRVTMVTKDNNLFLILSMSINGFDINVCLATEKVEPLENAQLRLKVKSMTIGDTVSGEDVKDKFLTLIESVMNDGAFNGLVALNKVGDDHFITISLRQLYAEKGINDTLYDFSVDMTSNTASDPGTLSFTAALKVTP